MTRELRYLNTSYRIADLDQWRHSFMTSTSCLKQGYIPAIALHVKQMSLKRQTQILIDDERRTYG